MFRKTNISNPLIRVRIRGLGMLVFRKILRTYLMDDPFLNVKIALNWTEMNWIRTETYYAQNQYIKTPVLSALAKEF